MRRINHLLLFLATLGGLTHKSVEDTWARELLEKTADANAPIYVSLQKDAGAVIRAGRLSAQAPEGTIMKAMGLDPANAADVKTYSEFETGAVHIEMTTDSIKAIAGAVKQDPVALAVSIINSSGADKTGAAPPTPPVAPPANKPPVPPVPPALGKSEEDGNLLLRIAKVADPADAAALNTLLLKSRQVRDGGGAALIQKSADDIKLEKSQKIGADILGLVKPGESVLEKTGISVETDFSPSGTNNPTLGRDLFEIASPQMAMLKDVQVVPMTSYHQEVLVVGKNNRTATVLTVGTEVTAGQRTNFINGSKVMDAADMDWAMMISDKTALQYQGNLPGLDATVTAMFTNCIAQEPEDLGINGTTDTFSTLFTEIRKGWYKQAVDAASAGTAWRLIDLSTGIGAGAIATIMGAFDAIISVHRTNNPVGLTNQHVFVVSPGDYGRYEAEYIAGRKADDVLTNGAPLKYRGYEIRVSPFAQDSKIMFTWLKNLIFGYVNAPNQGLRVDRRRLNKGMQIQVSLGVAFSVVDLNSMVVTQA